MKGVKTWQVESILAANSELLVAIKNVAGQAKDIGIVVDGYEVS